jgi:hypothetical protein
MNLLRPPPASGGKVVYFLCLLFILCVACITATHYMRSSSHDVFRFGCGETLREGLGSGCEPKDIILLGDELASDPIMSSIEENKKIGELLKDDKDKELRDLWAVLMQFSMMIKAASMMRSKPDEQIIRGTLAEMATKTKIECAKIIELTGTLEKSSLSVQQKDTIKKYATKMVNMGKCIGACK